MSHLLSAVECRLPSWALLFCQLSCTVPLYAERFLPPEVLSI